MLEFVSKYDEDERNNLTYKSGVNWTWVCDSTYKWQGKDCRYVIHLLDEKLNDELEVWCAGKLLAVHKVSGGTATGRLFRKLERYAQTV